MAGPDFKTVIESIRDHNEITDVIGQYVQLKKSGRTLKACCPFHKEKTPSFHVNPARQSFHCFGCGAGGDVFNFIMRHENVEFMEAARMLAERANLTFEFDPGASPEKTTRKSALLDLHHRLAEWYRRCLSESGQAAAARAYLEDREIDAGTAETFGIGYAPARDMNWPAWAAKRGFGMDLLVEAGVVIEREQGGWYDRFADRLMFPIHDESGRVIGFSGRILSGDTRPAKYVNSPETPLFTKSKVIYGLHHAKKAILDHNEAVVCEGQIDVIRCHIGGITHAVAAQGTAITDDHARILKRLCDSVRLVLDSDEAGTNAAMRSSDTLVAAGLQVMVASLPAGDDPDSMIRRDGAEAFLTVMETAVPALDFQVQTLLKREKRQDDAALLRIARAVLESIAHAPSDIQREQLLQHAGGLLGIRPDILNAEFQRLRRRPATRMERDEETAPPPSLPEHPCEELELLRLIMHYPESIRTISTYVDSTHLRSETCRLLYILLLEHAYDEDLDLMAELPADDSEARRVVAMLTAEDRFAGTELDIERAARELIIAVRKRDFDTRRRELEARRRTATAEEAARLDLEITEITLNQHTLRSGWDRAKWMLDVHRAMPD